MVLLTEKAFGTHESRPVKMFTWKTDSGFSLTAISYGAIVQSIKMADQYGTVKDLVLGFDDLSSYENRNVAYFGAVIGRCANRIGNASFQIDGITYQLAKNVGNNHLHGGNVGFDKVVWDTTVDGTKVTFSYLSKDLEEGYPGDLVTNVTYEVKDDESFHITYVATTTKKTVVNLTNHSYFNLAGHDGGAEELYKHFVTINAEKITDTDSNSIPSGRLKLVRGTPYDLRIAKRIGDVIDDLPNLFDDNFCVYGKVPDKCGHPQSHTINDLQTFVSRVTHPSSGRYLEVYSDQPGVQFYTSNFLPSPDTPALVGKGGVGYRRHGAFCLETQLYPDAVHHQNFQTSVLKPGDVYKQYTVYKFGVENSKEPNVVSA